MHQDVRLRVGRAAAEDRAVPLGRLERRGLPLRLFADRDDVVVAVEEDGRRARRRRDLRRRTARCPGARGEPTSTPASANSFATRSCACSSVSSVLPTTDTDGIRTSSSKSRRNCGIRDLIVSARRSMLTGVGLRFDSVLRPLKSVPASARGVTYQSVAARSLIGITLKGPKNRHQPDRNNEEERHQTQPELPVIAELVAAGAHHHQVRGSRDRRQE